jgi:ubiquinone/menaquinone biosynthesis C-methylase UbiE
MISEIRQRTVNVLQHWPALYQFVSRIYWALNFVHLKEHIFGTKAREKWWESRATVKEYWDNRGIENKNYLADRLAAFSPIKSVLEIGCASGPNLYVIAKKYPEAKIVGIDINPEAVVYGNTQFTKESMKNVTLLVGKADEMEHFPPRSFDIVFTNACLIYIGPDKIKEVIQGMLRIMNKGLILLECYCFEEKKDTNGMGYYDSGIWMRNYAALLKQFIPPERIKVTRLPEELWPMRPWRDYGAITEVSIQ